MRFTPFPCLCCGLYRWLTGEIVEVECFEEDRIVSCRICRHCAALVKNKPILPPTEHLDGERRRAA